MRTIFPRRASATESSPADDNAVLGNIARNDAVDVVEAGSSTETEATAGAPAPARPSLSDKEAPPVLVKVRPPFFVALSRILWVTSLIAGAVAIVYMFVIRQAQLPEIAELVRRVDGSRADATYTTAADILFWTIFAPSVVIILVQIMLQVSFAARRPNVRWWQFGTLLFQAGIFLMARELLAFGERGLPLERILLLQLGLALLGLLVSVLPQALRWTARKHDVRRGPVAPTAQAQL